MRRNWLSSVKPKAPVKPPLKPRPTGPLPVGLVLESWFWAHWQVVEVQSGSSSSSSTETTDSSNNNSGSTTTTPALIGRLLDGAVAGASYSSTSSLNGTTNANGEFSYREGDQVSFTIGGVLLGKANGSSIITPLELTGATTTADQRVVNLSRLLQTLDSDLDPANGIFISSSFRNAPAGSLASILSSLKVFASEGQHNSE